MEHRKMTLEILKNLIHDKNIGELRQAFNEFNIVDMSELVAKLETDEALFVFKVLRKNVTSEIFSYLPYEKQEILIAAFTGPEIQVMLDNLFSDDIVDFMEEMPANIVKRVLQSAKPTQRAEINKLLNYDENSCGSIMNTNYITLKRNENVLQSMERLRGLKKVDPTLGYAYITDTKRQLIGYLALKQLLFLDTQAKIDDIMQTDVIFVRVSDKQEEAARLIEKYDISTIPVVNDEGILAGAITVDDIIDVINEETTNDIYRMNAITPTHKPYLETGVFSMYRHRILWLLILMVGISFTANILFAFEGRLQGVAYLAVFIPLLMNVAGNASSQSSAMITRSLATGEIRTHNIFKVWSKEFRVALLCGLTMGAVNLLWSRIFMGMVDIDTSLIVSISVIFTVMIAKLIGCTLPMIALKLKFDPAVMAGPFITTLVDVIALLVYLGLASFFLL